MKLLKLLILGIVLIIAGSAQSQVSVNVHIGDPPSWGPSGYSDDVRYYYLPDVEAYYDIEYSRFIYISGNRWIRSSYLPTRYRHYDLNRGYKVVMRDYRGNSPYTHFKEHKTKYCKGYRDRDHRNHGEWNEGRSHRQRNNHSYRQPVRRHEYHQVRGNNQGHSRGHDKHDDDDHEDREDRGHGKRK